MPEIVRPSGPIPHNCAKDKCHSGLLTRYEIDKYGIIKAPSYDGKNWKINGTEIDGNLENNLYQPSSFDLTLGHASYVYGNAYEDKKWNPGYIGPSCLNETGLNDGDFIKYTEDQKNPGCLIIPPFGSALVQLNEFVDTRSNAMVPEKALIAGRFDLKLSVVIKGLISQQATQVEPFYYGHLYCFLHNISSDKIKLNHRDPIVTIEFSYLSCRAISHDEKKHLDYIEILKTHNEKYKNNRFCNENGIIDIRYFDFTPKRYFEQLGLLIRQPIRRSISHY